MGFFDRFKKDAAPEKKAAPKKDSAFQNLQTKLGAFGYDKGVGVFPTTPRDNYRLLEALYRSSALAARVVDLPVVEALRNGFTLSIPGQDASAAESALQDLQLETHLDHALRYQRLYGGAAILLGVNDGLTDLSQPLGEVRSLDYLAVFAAHECTAQTWQDDPTKPGFGLPNAYQISGNNALNAVHSSRIVRISAPIFGRDRAWGESPLARVRDAISSHGATWQSINHALAEFAQTVYAIDGLTELILNGNEDVIVKRMQAIDQGRSVMRGILLDAAGEKFERVSTPFTGVAELLARQEIRIAAEAGIPSSILFGQSPNGLGATGNSEMRFFYDSISAMQKSLLTPAIEQIARAYFGSKEPADWGVRFGSLWQPSDTEKATVRLQMAQADDAYFQIGVLSAEDITRSRFGGDQYSLDTSVK